MLGAVTRRRLLWLTLTLAVLGVALLVTAVLVNLSTLVRQVAVWQLQAQTGRPVTLEALDVRLAQGRLVLRGLRIADHDGGPLAEIDRLEAHFDAWSLLRGSVWVRDVALIGGHVRVVRTEANRLNVADLLERPAASGSPLDTAIDRFTLSGVRLTFEDRMLQPARAWRAELRLDGRDLTTRGRRGTAVASVAVAGALVTVRFDDWQLAPAHVLVRVNVRDLDLRLATLYLPDDGPLTLHRGDLSAGATVVVDSATGVHVDAEALVEGLVLRRRGTEEDTLTTPRLEILVRELHQRPGALALRYASLGGDVSVLDPTQTPPTPLTFADLTVTASDLEQPMKGPARVAAHASIPGGGEVDVTGTAGAVPRRADVRVRARGLALATVARYLPLEGRLAGTASADVRVVATHEGSLQLTVTGDAIVDRITLGDGGRTLAGASRVRAGGLQYHWPATLAVGQLTVTQPTVTVERAADGTIGLTSLLRAPPGPAQTGHAGSPPAAPDVRIATLEIEAGRAVVTDETSGIRVEVTGLRTNARDLTWPGRGPATVELSAAVAGARVSARGSIDLAERQADLGVGLRGVDLAALQPWLPIVGRLRGSADADVTASVGLEPFSLAVRGAVGVTDVAFLDATRPLLTVGRVDATGIDLQWPERLTIDRLRVNMPWAQIDRTPEGELSLRALFRRRPGRPAPPPPEAASKATGLVAGLELSVREALFENGGANIVDDTVEPAARFEIRGSRLALRDLTWPAQGSAAVQLSTPMPGRGVLKAHGTFSIEPTRLQLTAELDQVDLAPGRPYLPIDARVAGRLTGRARIDGTFGETITLAIDGDTTVERLALGDADRRLATAQRVELTGVRYRYPASVRVRQVTVSKPWALVERNADGQLEILSLLNQRRRDLLSRPGDQPTGTSTTGDGVPVASPAAGRVRVAITRLTLDDGFLRFVDRTTNPDYAEELTGIALTAEGLGTNPRRHGTVDLRGTFASGTPLTLTGRISSFTGPPFLDLTVGVKEFPVPRLNPYLDRLSSWIARQGVLTASLRYKLDGDELEASNDVRLTGLDLDQGGRGNEVQRRIGLPLGLLVSLLKNRQGEIELSIPVRGRLSAPEFEYSEAVWAGLRGLAINLVSLPFSWIGQMLYTEDARIESVQVYPVPFQTARAIPTPFGGDQIERLGTFLQAQPAIRLRLRPVTTVTDVAVLRRQALDARLAESGADAVARRQAALALYAELFPRRPPPPSDEVLFEELARETPTPPRALRALATERTAAVRGALIRAGVGAERLEPAESRAAVEAEGDPRVEFEIIR
jgi:hypothetical protein